SWRSCGSCLRPEEESHHAELGHYIPDYCNYCCRPWVRRYRGYCNRYCQDPVRGLPGAVRSIADFRSRSRATCLKQQKPPARAAVTLAAIPSVFSSELPLVLPYIPYELPAFVCMVVALAHRYHRAHSSAGITICSTASG